MTLFDRLEPLLLAAADALWERIPQAPPPEARLRACRIVAHRGEHDNRRLFENTLAAFEAAAACGAWGIECDLRWTADEVAVVTHDPDLGRLWGVRERIRELSFAELRRRVPEVPSLAEVVQRFGGRLHLMVEIKDEPWPDPAGRNRRLARIFEGLRPREDYHLLALDPRLFGRIRFAPASCFVAVAQGLPAAASRIALAAGFAGIAAHYLLLSDRRLSRHHAAGQSAGTGYARSLPVLFREVGRGVDWVFTNHAGALLGALAALSPPVPPGPGEAGSRTK